VIDIGSPSDFAEGTVTITRAGKQEIGVIRWDDTLYAVRNVCPHQSGPVCSGQLLPLLTAPRASTAGLSRDWSRPVLTCPWHGWEFDLHSGRALWDGHYRLRTYAIEVRDGRVLVDTRRHGRLTPA
jgi:nitrite reductase/ring-hydroxylating ferredoxin subunit